MNSKNILFKSGNERKTYLDKAYNNHIKSLFDELDDDKKARWEIYNVIVEELTNNTDEDHMKEIKYRLTDGEDPNEIILDIIDRHSDNLHDVIWFLRKKIEDYIDEDFFNKFLI